MIKISAIWTVNFKRAFFRNNLRQYCLILSQSAKTYDSPAVKSIFALLLEEVTRPEQAHSKGRNALKKWFTSTPILPENRIFQIAVFVYVAHEQLLSFPEKEFMKVSFSGFFYVNCNKTRTENTAHCQSNNPYYLHPYTPGKSAFSDPIFLVFCQLCRTYIS